MLAKHTQKIIRTAVQAMITHDMEEWPPSCFGLLYQPMRPYRKNVQEAPSVRMNAHDNNSTRT